MAKQDHASNAAG